MGSSDSDAARHQRVQRRLLTGQSLMRPKAWSDLDGQSLSFLQAMLLLLVLMPLELSLYDFPVPWAGGRFATALVATPWPTVLAVGGGCALVNAFLLAGKLRRETPSGVVVRPWLRALGYMVGFVPILGLSVFTGWDWLRTRRPSWAFKAARGPTLDLQDIRRSSWNQLHHGRRFSLEVLKSAWLFLANSLALGLVCLRLSLSPDLSSRQVTLLATILAHVLICIDMVHVQMAENRRYTILGRRGTVKRFLPLLCLLPLPVVMLYLVVMLDDKLLDPRASTLTTAAYRNRQSMNRLPAWSRMQSLLDRSLAFRRLRQRLKTGVRTPEPGALGERLTRLYQLKTALLASDALALGWLLSLALSPGTIDALLGWMLRFTLGVAATGYFLSLAMVGARAVNQAWGGIHVYGSILAASQLTFLAGLYPGALLEQGRLRDAGILVALSCAAAAMIYVFSEMLGHLIAEALLDTGALFLWTGILLATALVGTALALDDPLAHALEKVVVVLAFLSPLWHAVLAVRFVGSLLHPFDVRSPRVYPRPIRRTLGVLAATLALPLGGLAVPYWIYVRRRHWPAYERLALGEARP